MYRSHTKDMWIDLFCICPWVWDWLHNTKLKLSGKDYDIKIPLGTQAHILLPSAFKWPSNCLAWRFDTNIEMSILLTCSAWGQRGMITKPLRTTQELLLYRLEFCRETWIQNAEHIQTQLKNSPLRSVPTMGASNAVDVLPSQFFLLLEPVINTLGHSHFTNKQNLN